MDVIGRVYSSEADFTTGGLGWIADKGCLFLPPLSLCLSHFLSFFLFSGFCTKSQSDGDGVCECVRVSVSVASSWPCRALASFKNLFYSRFSRRRVSGGNAQREIVPRRH